MTRRTKIHVGLEIGTSKVCMVVGEVKADSAVKILGIGETKSAGVRKGEIYDYSQTRACLKDALAKAEDASDVEIHFVMLQLGQIQDVSDQGFHKVNLAFHRDNFFTSGCQQLVLQYRNGRGLK